MNIAFIREVGLVQWLRRTVIRQAYKRIIRRDHAMQLPSGGRFELPRSSRFATEAFVTGGDVDWGSELLLYRLLRGHGAFLDIGANVGYYCAYMMPKCKVHAFEPDPRMLAHLRRALGADDRVHILPVAVGRTLGRARFSLELDGEVSHLERHSEAGALETIDVDVETVDHYVIANALRVEGIKTDVEGFDLDVLLGARETLRVQRPIVLSEIEPTVELFGLLDSVGYCVLAFVRDRQTRRRRFIRISRDSNMAGRVTKMLFLVPGEAADTVELAASAMSSMGDAKRASTT